MQYKHNKYIYYDLNDIKLIYCKVLSIKLRKGALLWHLESMYSLAELICNPTAWLTFGGVAVASVLYIYNHLQNMYSMYKGIPGFDSFSPIFGNMHLFPMEAPAQYKFVLDWLTTHHRLRLFWVGPLRPMIFVFHPDIAKIILQSSEPKPVGFGDVFTLLKPWTGEGLLVANGNKWYRNRHLLTPAFHFDILRPYVSVYNRAADILLENIDKLAKSGQSFDIYPLLKLCAFDIILKCAMSVDLDVQRQGDVPYLKSSEKLAELWGKRIPNILQYWDFVYKRTSDGQEFFKHCNLVHAFAEDIIEKRRKILETGGPSKKRYLDFVDILLTAKDDMGEGLSLAEIRAEVDTFLFAGHETVSTAASWLVHLLSENQDYQHQAQQEVDSLLSGRDSTDILWADLVHLEMLTCCLKESLRLFPPAPVSGRLLTRDTAIDGIKIPAGTRVIVSMVLMHRNPDVWENPDNFCPERFEPKKATDRDPFAFVPFSAGPRNCIGQTFALNEIKVLVAKLLQRYELTPDPNHPVIPISASIVQAEKGIWVYAKHRDTWTSEETMIS